MRSTNKQKKNIELSKIFCYESVLGERSLSCFCADYCRAFVVLSELFSAFVIILQIGLEKIKKFHVKNDKKNDWGALSLILDLLV